MNPIDPHEVAQRAEEARRRAEALARLKQEPPTPRDLFEIQQTGPYNYLLRGGGEEIWADGIRVSRGHALEAKFVERAARSPFVNGSTTPPFIRGAIRNEVEDEFRRYAAVILDRNNPLRGLEVITNDPAAVPYFEALLRRFGLNGRVVVRGSR